SKKVEASKARWAPTRQAASVSTMKASAAPLASAMGTMVPASALAGSVVGLPSTSSAQPCGIASPRCLAAMMLPRATFDTERSTTTGGRPVSGAAKAMGLVPKAALPPPQGAMALGMVAGDAAMVRAADRRRRHALRACDSRQLGDGEVDGGKGEAEGRVDGEDA